MELHQILMKAKMTAKEPSLWRVVFYDDDFTPMDFVTAVLVRYFNKQRAEAEAIMLMIHQTGSGSAGVYTKEIALAKVQRTTQIARLNEHPLLVQTEIV